MTKPNHKTYAGPKHRAIVHLAADMRKGAGAHSVPRKPGPSVDEWDEVDVAENEEEIDE